MPPRRPGGKYRGAIKRELGEDAIGAMLDKEKSKMMQKFMKEIKEQKVEYRVQATEAQTLKATRMKVVQAFLGTRKIAKAAFKNWIRGMFVMRHERNKAEREYAWRSSCTAPCAEPGCRQCSSFAKLTDVAFRMPFDVAREAAMKMEATAQQVIGGRAKQLLPPLVSVEQAMRPVRAKSLTDIKACSKKTNIPCRCSECVLKSGNQMKVGPNFMDYENAVPTIHYKTGRRCFLDESQMRFCIRDATRTCALFGMEDSALAAGTSTQFSIGDVRSSMLEPSVDEALERHLDMNTTTI